MTAAVPTVKLRCKSWSQLRSIYERDLCRQAFFLKTPNPPPVGIEVRLQLTLPSGSVLILSGLVKEHVPAGGMGGRGPGVDLALNEIPASAMWMIESALKKAAGPPTPPPGNRTKDAPGQLPQKSPAPPAEARLDDDEDVAAAESELIRALWSELDGISKMNPFQILGLDYRADHNAVRSAFGKLTKKYHPDRFSRYESEEIRHLASELFISIRDAYKLLETPAGREQALQQHAIKSAESAQLDRSDSGQRRRRSDPAAPLPPPPKPGAVVKPPPRPLMATPNIAPPAVIPPIAPDKRPPSAPVRPASVKPLDKPLTPPVPARVPARKEPPVIETPETHRRGFVDAPFTAMGDEPVDIERTPQGDKASMAEKMLEQGDYERAVSILRVEQRRQPVSERVRALLELADGLRCLVAGDRMEAAEHFEMVLELDPSNERAARELADMRRQAVEQRRGLLTKLMGKKS